MFSACRALPIRLCAFIFKPIPEYGIRTHATSILKFEIRNKCHAMLHVATLQITIINTYTCIVHLLESSTTAHSRQLMLKSFHTYVHRHHHICIFLIHFHSFIHGVFEKKKSHCLQHSSSQIDNFVEIHFKNAKNKFPDLRFGSWFVRVRFY